MPARRPAIKTVRVEGRGPIKSGRKGVKFAAWAAVPGQIGRDGQTRGAAANTDSTHSDPMTRAPSGQQIYHKGWSCADTRSRVSHWQPWVPSRSPARARYRRSL